MCLLLTVGNILIAIDFIYIVYKIHAVIAGSACSVLAGAYTSKQTSRYFILYIGPIYKLICKPTLSGASVLYNFPRIDHGASVPVCAESSFIDEATLVTSRTLPNVSRLLIAPAVDRHVPNCTQIAARYDF